MSRRQQPKWLKVVLWVLLLPFALASRINDWVYGWRRR